MLEICGANPEDFDYESREFKLSQVLDLDMVKHSDDVEEVTDGADKQLKIEVGLEEIEERWTTASFIFKEWRGRGVNILQGTVAIMEELEETQMNLQAFLTMRHVTPFRERAQELLTSYLRPRDLERWLKVQMMWCSSSVFTGGDIAKQMPVEAKKFGKVDKEWPSAWPMPPTPARGRGIRQRRAAPVAAVMYVELEKCQKSLEGYLEQKRNKFPRFYFVSNPGLLIILSQGSDPLSMNDHYEKVFDAITYVEHNKKDKTIIEKMHGDGGQGHEIIPFSTPVKAVGNIEDWLVECLKKMQLTMKDLTRSAAGELATVASDVGQLRGFVDNNISQLRCSASRSYGRWTCRPPSTRFAATRSHARCAARQAEILSEMSRWCLQDLGTSINRRKIETPDHPRARP